MMNNKKLLIIDDEESIREGLKTYLQFEGYIADTANCAEDALKLDISSYNLILLDIMMDKMSGIELAAQLKCHDSTKNIPIIFITAKDQDEEMVNGLRLGADDYIVKPFYIKNVLARIELVEKSIQQRFEADKMINALMNELVEDFNINRAMMFELHNGSQNLSGIEYLFYSATSEVISNTDDKGNIVYDLDYEADSYQKQHVANFVGQIVYDRMRHEKYLYFPNLENYHRTSYRFLNKLHQNGANSALVIPFVSNNIPLVLLVCTSKNSEMDAAAIYKYVERYRSSIERNLMVLSP